MARKSKRQLENLAIGLAEYCAHIVLTLIGLMTFEDLLNMNNMVLNSANNSCYNLASDICGENYISDLQGISIKA